MASGKNKSPDFFEDHWIDPVAAATRTQTPMAVKRKRKVGFYISEDLLNRFNRKFHELKLAGIPIDNKSALVEMALTQALDDLDKGKASHLLQQLG
jgi:hypothetical protein